MYIQPQKHTFKIAILNNLNNTADKEATYTKITIEHLLSPISTSLNGKTELSFVYTKGEINDIHRLL
jgi:hypothetical protein